MRFINQLKHILTIESERQMLLVPVLLGLGIAWYFGLSAEPEAVLGLKIVLVLCSLTLIFRRFAWTWLTLAASIAALGFYSAEVRTQLVAGPLLHKPVFATEVEGRVHQVVFDENAYKLILSEVKLDKLDLKQTPQRVRISIKQADRSSMPQVGSIVRLRATLFPLPSPTSPGAFDIGRMMFFDRLGAIGFSLETPEVLATSSQPLSERIYAFRQHFAGQLMALMPENMGAVAAALTVGEQGSVTKEDAEAMRASGLYHILSISGLHLALAAGIVFYVVRFSLVLIPGAALHYPIKKMAAVAALISAFLYLLAAGWPVPAQRSFIMVAVVLFAVLLDRKGFSLNTLAWAATFILLCFPESLMGASFQLSFAATAAIVALYERFGYALHASESGFIRKLFRAVFATMMVSLAATFATAPFIITYFNQVQLMGLVANVLVTPLTSFLIMPTVVLAFLLKPLGLLFLAARPLEWGIEGMLAIAHHIAALPYASIYVPSYTISGLVLSVLGLLLLVGLRTRFALMGVAFLALGACSMLLTKTPHVLISDDAKQIAVRDAGENWVMIKGGPNSFTTQAWMKKLGKASALPLKEGIFDTTTALKCTESDCTYTCKSGTVLFMKQPKKTKTRCTSNYTVAVLPYRLWKGECDGVKVIDRDALVAGGAHAMYCGDRLNIENVRQFQGDRPWVP